MNRTIVDDARAARRGHAQAFERLVERHCDGVYGLCCGIVGNFHDAEDLAQEALVRAHARFQSLRDPNAFAGWLASISRNLCRDWLRANTRKQRMELLTPPRAMTSVPAEAGPAALEAEDSMARALSALPEQQRDAVTLYYVNGYSFADVALFLDTTRAAVKGRVQRARARLRKEFVKRMPDEFEKRRLKPGFPRRVLRKALARAKDAHEKWDKHELASAQRQAEALLADAGASAPNRRSETELFKVLGDAATTWLGQPELGLRHYRRALDAALDLDDHAERGVVLRAMTRACARHGFHKELSEVATQGMAAFEAAGDHVGYTIMAAAHELSQRLPRRWRPHWAGGFAMGAFPIERYRGGLRFLEASGIRDSDWTHIAQWLSVLHWYHPRRFLSTDPKVGKQWRDDTDIGEIYRVRGVDPGPIPLRAVSTVESDRDTVPTPAGVLRDCLRVRTRIFRAGDGRAPEHMARTLYGTRIAWYARGVGLVKLRHEDQNTWKQFVYLVEYDGDRNSRDWFPLVDGRHRRFRWYSGLHGGFVEEVCTVAATMGNIAFVGLAGFDVAPTSKEVEDYFRQLAEAQRKYGGAQDAVEQVDEVLLRTAAGRRSALRRRLVALRTELAGEPPDE